MDYKIEQLKADTDKRYKDAMIEEQKKRTEIELE